MHYSLLVITDRKTIAGARARVDALMAPHVEGGEYVGDGDPDTDERDDVWSSWGWYDWYVVGGRWTGHLDGYDPDADPALQEPCEYCEGTGTTTQRVADRYPAYGKNVGKECFQCKGRGMRTVYSTQWPERDGDFRTVGYLLDHDVRPTYAILSPKGRVVNPHEDFSPSEGRDESWFREEVAKHPRDRLAVIVDYHS